jgi:septum formation protein
MTSLSEATADRRAPPRLVLASASPRRSALLERAGLAFEVWPAGVDESARPDEPPEALVERLALAKARAVAERLGGGPGRLVLGSDTVVVLGEAVLGKPRDPDHAVALLSSLVGRTHRVLSGVALVESDGPLTASFAVESRVRMRAAGEDEIRAYVATGEPLDKAGAYAVQGRGRRFVTAIEGSESNVIGLPLGPTLALLSEAGLAVPSR